MHSQLAINGGEPVRAKPLPMSNPGSATLGREEAEAAAEVLYAQSPFRYYGPNVLGRAKQFEREFARKIGAKHALGVTSGTSALICALKACGIGPGDKVIVPACTFVATAGAAICAGAVPVFCDIDESLNMDPAGIEKVADKYTRAVIPVPILGAPCRMDEIMAAAKRLGLMVIEDVAQSMGCQYKGRTCGTFGDMGAFSLQAHKMITTGEGGAVVTDDARLHERAVRYHDQGGLREPEDLPGDELFAGQNYRMSEITGAVACAQLQKLDGILASLRGIKKTIKDELRGVVPFRRVDDEAGDAANTFMMLFPDAGIREKFEAALRAEGIACGCLYGGRPVYMQPQIFQQKTAERSGFPFNQFDEPAVYTEDMCPRALEIMPRNLIVQLSPLFTEEDTEDIIKATKKVAAEVLK